MSHDLLTVVVIHVATNDYPSHYWSINLREYTLIYFIDAYTYVYTQIKIYTHASASFYIIAGVPTYVQYIYIYIYHIYIYIPHAHSEEHIHISTHIYLYGQDIAISRQLLWEEPQPPPQTIHPYISYICICTCACTYIMVDSYHGWYK